MCPVSGADPLRNWEAMPLLKKWTLQLVAIKETQTILKFCEQRHLVIGCMNHVRLETKWYWQCVAEAAKSRQN